MWCLQTFRKYVHNYVGCSLPCQQLQIKHYCTLQSSSVFINFTEFNYLTLKITKYVLCSARQDTAARHCSIMSAWCCMMLHDVCLVSAWCLFGVCMMLQGVCMMLHVMAIILLTADPLLTRMMKAEHIGCLNHVCPLSTLCALVNIPTCPNFSMGITPHWTPVPRLIGFTADGGLAAGREGLEFGKM